MSFEPVSFASQLVATLIGAGVGFGFVIWRDRSKKKIERKETRNMMIDSLVAEMQENLDGLNNYQVPTWNVNDGKFKGDFGLVSDYTFQSIVNGGNFLALPITWQKPTREIYQNVELFNKFMDQIINFTEFQANRASLVSNELLRRLQQRKNELQTILPDAIKGLTSLKEK